MDTIPEYQRPQAKKEDIDIFAKVAVRMTNGKSMADIRKLLIVVLTENYSLAQECNEHRRARGFAEMKLERPKL